MKKLKKGDLIVAGAVLVIALATLLIVQIFVKKDGETAVIKIDGQIKYELPLNKDTVVEINGYDGGTNTVVIENKHVHMSDADCPDKLCVNMGKISKTGETIVCMPHRVSIEITGTQESIDSVVQ